MADRGSAVRLREAVKAQGSDTVVLDSDGALEELAGNIDADRVLNAVVGSAGLKVSLKALDAGVSLALANKESMVAAGELMNEASKRSKTPILPVDSEHSAIWQCIWASRGSEVDEIMLTASGGPFRGMKDLYRVRPEQALKHPNWVMGSKITIDSATMINKALEVIEAHWLFGSPPERIKVIVHPQSIVHSAVRFKDGSVIAQMGVPDMRLPIMTALSYPERSPSPPEAMARLDLLSAARLDFEAPDETTFPGVLLGHKALAIGGVAPAIMSAANEAAVEAFLHGSIPFTMISELSEDAMANGPRVGASSAEAVLEADSWARSYVESRCAIWHSCHS